MRLLEFSSLLDVIVCKSTLSQTHKVTHKQMNNILVLRDNTLSSELFIEYTCQPISEK